MAIPRYANNWEDCGSAKHGTIRRHHSWGFCPQHQYKSYKEKEVYFNERNEWMGTSWDVQVANLPEAVKKSVMEKYSDYVIDDADYVVTPDNEWYILDLENKQIDKELKVKVDKDGVWL